MHITITPTKDEQVVITFSKDIAELLLQIATILGRAISEEEFKKLLDRYK